MRLGMNSKQIVLTQLLHSQLMLSNLAHPFTLVYLVTAIRESFTCDSLVLYGSETVLFYAGLTMASSIFT